ncbi:hypothetical protein Tco_0809552 [Tanacetum coccineum]
MADLEFVDQHNMVACLEKTAGNSEFHEIVDFLTSSLIHHALTVSPTIYISYIEQFWNTASSQTVNDEKRIHATVDSKAVVVTEASIRSSLLLNDADGTACLTNEAIFQNLALMGYDGELSKLTFQKTLFSPQWKYLIHTILHCLSLKSTSWNEFSTNIASAVICLATNQKFNFSKLIFDGMLRNLDNPKKKFHMYPRSLMVFLNNHIELGEPFNDVYITPAHTLKVFSNMSRKGLKFLGRITPLFSNMLASAEVEKGEGSEKPTQPQPTPYPTQPRDQVQLSNDSPHSGGNTSERAEGGLNLEELLSLCTNLSNMVLTLETAKDAQAAKILKLKTRMKKMEKLEKKCKPTHGMDYMDTEEAVTEGRQSNEIGEKNVTHDIEVLEKGGSNEELVNAAGNIGVSITFNISTASRPEVSTATPMTPPTTTSVFEDEDIFLADSLLMLSDKAKLKGVEIKEKKDAERPAISVLTLKPLPKIDPKDKGKGVLEEEPELVKVKSKDQGKAQIERDAKIALKVQAELDEEARLERQRQEQASLNYITNLYDEVQARIDADHELAIIWTQEEQEKYIVDERAKLLVEYFENRKKYKHAQLNKNTLEEIQVLYIKEQERIADFVPIGSEEDERLIQEMNKKVAGEHKEKVLEEPDSTKVEIKQEGTKESTRKRRLKMKATKKFRMQNTDSDLKEGEHLKTFLKLVPDEEEIIDYERLDLEELYNLVMQRVHSLILEDGTEIHMLTERKYLLTKETLERMLSLKLIAESASESAYNLLSKELASPKQTALSKDISNPLIVDISLDLSRLATTLNRLERSIQTGINKWYQSLLRNSDFVVPVFSLGDDPIACLNKAMAFLTTIASSRFPSTNNQLRTSLNPRNKTTIQDDKVKDIWLGNALSLSDQGMQHDGQAVQTIITNNAAFQTKDLNTYDSNCDDISNAQAVLMANISNYGSDVISEPHSETYLNDMENQSLLAMQDFEQPPVVDITDNEIHITAELESYKEQVKIFEQRLNIDLSSRKKMIDSQMDDMIKEKLALKEQVDSLEQNLSKQIKEKECLLQTFTIFKSESKEKEDKYVENEIDLEKKIKELDNILFKVGQSAQIVHMLTKPQAFYDNIHKQALGYQNPFYFRKAQRIKPTLYDDIVIFDKHVAMHVIDDEETLILEEKSRSKMSKKAKDPEIINKNISHKPIDYEKLNRLSEDFGKRFTPQQEMDAKQAFDNVVKIRTTPDACIEGKEIVDIAAQIPSASTIVPGMFKLNSEPLAHRLLQNRDVHIKYLKYDQEQAYILQGIELLVYVRDTCPNAINLSAKEVSITPKNKVKKVRFAEPLTSSRNVKHVESSKISDSNTPMLSSTGLKCSISKCGSKPTGNKRNDGISQTTSRNMKNKVKAQPRKVNKKNC